MAVLREGLWAGGGGQSMLDRPEQDGSTGTLSTALHMMLGNRPGSHSGPRQPPQLPNYSSEQPPD